MNKLLFAFAAFAGILIISSCGSKEAPVQEKIRPVKSMIIGDIGDATGKGFPGVTKETKESEMSFRVGGPITRLNVRDGARVRKGALIAEIDPRDYLVNVQSTEARYNQTKAESDRFYRLWQKGSVAKNEYERRFANYQEAEATWEDAKNALIDTKLFAPYGGFYGPRLVDMGEEVRPKQAVTTIVDLSVIEVDVIIPEQLAVQFISFDKYEVHIEVYPDLVFSATLKELEKKPTAEGYPLHLFLDHVNNPNNPNQSKVSAGMSCRINISLKKAEGELGKIIVPITAVFESNLDDQTAVWIIDTEGGTVRKQDVTIGSIIGNDAIEIVEGLEMGQQIVIAGVHRLSDGDKIKILDSE
ncbi:MAG TPA: efflux RND transporter periplasmic adaptor subunit [Bacteroides sp.]|nr:efflux RND transporter periplasmic adaptor subunit [Bacteroides sp.]